MTSIQDVSPQETDCRSEVCLRICQDFRVACSRWIFAKKFELVYHMWGTFSESWVKMLSENGSDPATAFAGKWWIQVKKWKIWGIWGLFFVAGFEFKYGRRHPKISFVPCFGIHKMHHGVVFMKKYVFFPDGSSKSEKSHRNRCTSPHRAEGPQRLYSETLK